MSERGHYTLEIECDRAGCDKADDFTAMSAEFEKPTRMHALEAARDAGWMLRRKCKVLCPFHATEKRARRR